MQTQAKRIWKHKKRAPFGGAPVPAESIDLDRPTLRRGALLFLAKQLLVANQVAKLFPRYGQSLCRFFYLFFKLGESFCNSLLFKRIHSPLRHRQNPLQFRTISRAELFTFQNSALILIERAADAEFVYPFIPNISAHPSNKNNNPQNEISFQHPRLLSWVFL